MRILELSQKASTDPHYILKADDKIIFEAGVFILRIIGIGWLLEDPAILWQN